MTSLARQLERLAIPGQPSLRQLVSKKRPSLLFDRREAADMDADTFFSLGRNGLEELIAIDPTFSQFEDTLFQESSKEFERSVQTPDVLDELDRNLSVFLRRLSPYLLLKPAQKCLEWLVHAYRVHSCNVDAVLECVLPYYETKLFARAVQLLPLKSPSSRWHWLRPLQKAGSPLSRLSLVQHCLSDLSFLVFLCEMVPRTVSVHKHSPPGSLRSVLAFYCSTVILVLESDSGTNEEVIGRLLPYLLKGLKSRVAEYRAASYMIAGQLASKTNLEDRVSRSLLDAITKHLGPELGKEALCCAGVVCHTQNVAKLSNKTVRNLLRVSGLPSLMASLCSSHNVSPLLKLTLSALINAHFSGNHGDEVAMEMILTVLDEVPLDEEVVLSLIRELLEHFVSECAKSKEEEEEEEEEEGDGKGNEEEEEMESVKSSVASLAQSLDAKYPLLMDKALQNALVEMAATRKRSDVKQEDSDEEREGEGEGEDGEEGEGGKGEGLRWVHEFVAAALPGSRHQVVRRGKRGRCEEGGEGTLVLSVHHPQPSVREAAVRQLGKLLRHKSKKGGLQDREFVSSCLASRLHDEEPSVVAAVLELGGKVLSRYVPTELLLPPLSSVITRPNLPLSPTHWQDIATSALSLLTSPPLSNLLLPEQLNDIIITSLPLLFVHRCGNRLAGGVASVLCEADHVLVNSLRDLMENEDWRSGCRGESERDSEVLAAANSSLVRHLGSILTQLQPSVRHQLVEKLLGKATSTSPDNPAHFLFIGMLGVAMETDSTHSQYWLRPALSLLQYARESVAELTESPPLSPLPSLPDVLRPLVRKNVKTHQAHSMLLLWLLNTIVTHLPTVEVSTEMWLGVPGDDETNEQGLYHSALLSLFSLLTSPLLHDMAAQPAQHLLRELLKVHLSNRGHLLRFLAMMWTAPVALDDPPPPSCVSVATQASSLAVFSSYLKCVSPQNLLGLTTQFCPVVPSLLIPLTSPYQPIRQQILACLSLLQSSPACLPPSSPHPSYSTTPILYLLDNLAESELSLTSDPSFLPHLLNQLFATEDTASPSTRRHRKTRKKLELRERTAVLDGLLGGILTHVVTLSPPPHIQASLLRLLEHVDSELKVSATQPLLKELLDKCSSHARPSPKEGQLSPYEVETLRLCLGCLTPHVASRFLETFLHSSDTRLSFQLLLRALTLTTPTSHAHPSPLEMALHQVTPAFFSALSADSLKINLFNSLLSLLTTTQRSEVVTMVKNCIKKLELSGELVGEVLTGLSRDLGEDPPPPPTPTRKKQRHTKEAEPSQSSSTNEQGLPHGWKAITVLLELLQDSCSSSLTDPHLLTPHYFALLSRCLQAEEGERLQLEYTQQLLLGGLLSICRQLASGGIEEARALIPESVFNMELVVQCVRLSPNPLTHHHALLLLSSATALYPSRVLHNIMPVFTFMGSSLMRSDDSYSFQVITQTLDSVIPILVQSGSSVLPSLATTPHPTPRSSHRRPRPQTTPTSTEDVVTEIVRVFVDAIPHVPDHRRLPLLSHLLLRVGPAHFLSVALGLLLTKHVEQLGVKEQTPKEAVLSGSFPVSVAQLFCVELQLQAVGQLLTYTTSLPLDKPHSASAVRQLPACVNRVFNVATHSQKQLQQFKCSSFSLMSSLLSHRKLTEQVSCVVKDSLTTVEANIHCILQGSLDYETVVSRHKPTPQSKSSSLKLHLSLVNKISDVVGHVTALLTPGSLVAVVMHLLGVAGEEVKTKALKIVARKLEEGKSYFSSDQDECLVELLGAVVGVAKSDSAHLLTRHSAVYCVKLLARRLAHGNHHTHLTQALHEMLSLLSHSHNLSSELTGSCLLSVAEISSSLGPHLIPHLPLSLPPVMSRLTEGIGVMVQTAAVATLGVIVQTLPKFLSSFAATIVEKICWLERREGGGEGKERIQLAKEAALTREKVAKLVPARTLVPVYVKVHHLICPLGKGPLLALLEMVRVTVSSLAQEDARSLSPQLGDLFTLCLDHRAQHRLLSQMSMDDLEEVEGKCVEAFTQLVVHLSESLFRPVFLKFLDWATNRGADEERLIAFYHLAHGVAGKLKGLFLLFAGHIVKNMASLLERTNQDHHQESPVFQDDPLREEKTSVLLSHLLNTLHKIFLHSQPTSSSSSSFITRERFETLMTPLIHQISNQVGGESVFQRRVETLLRPCVAQLAVAAGREELWKPLNYQLLLKTRHKRAEVRYAVVVVLKEVYSRLGNEFMTLLPETIPFLAELLEDESEEVEQETRSLISTIETHVGESIQQYFT